MTRFSTLHPDGRETNVREINQSDLMACPFAILVPEHYRADGSCKCDDRKHRSMMILEWEYTQASFAAVGLLGEKALVLHKLVEALFRDRKWTVEFMRKNSGDEGWGLAFHDRDGLDRTHFVWGQTVEALIGPFIAVGACKGGDTDDDGVTLNEVELVEPFLAALELARDGGRDGE